MKPDPRLDADIDAAIDRAVRSMMDAEPRAGLRQRVLSRINEAPRRAFPMLRVAIAGLSVAAVAAAVAIHLANRPAIREELVTATPPPIVSTPRERVPQPIPSQPIAPAPSSLTPRAQRPARPQGSSPAIARDLVV